MAGLSCSGWQIGVQLPETSQRVPAGQLPAWQTSRQLDEALTAAGRGDPAHAPAPASQPKSSALATLKDVRFIRPPTTVREKRMPAARASFKAKTPSTPDPDTKGSDSPILAP
jgi:hypothetical protein